MSTFIVSFFVIYIHVFAQNKNQKNELNLLGRDNGRILVTIMIKSVKS